MAAAIFLLPFVDLSPVFQVSEGREGVVVQEILRTGEFILPLRHGDTVPSKPILFHWISTILARGLGSYGELGLRLPSTLAALGTVWAVFSAARALAGAVCGWISAVVLLSTYCFLHLARDGRVDMLFCSFVTVAVALWLREAAQVVERGASPADIPPRTYTLAGIVCGLAILTKGPLGIVLPFTIVASITAGWWGVSGLKSVVRPGWIWSVIVSLPWYVLATASGRDSFLARQIIFENIQRLLGGPGIPAKPITFYLEHFWLEAAPWSVVLALAVIRLFAARQGPEYLGGDKTRFAFRAGCSWLIATLVLFSLASGKRRAYLLPGMPGLALAIAALISAWHRQNTADIAQERKISRAVFLPGITAWLLLSITVTGLLVALSTGWLAERSAAAGLYADSLIQAVQRKPLLLSFYFAVLSIGSLAYWVDGFRRNSLLKLELGAALFLQLIFCVVVNTLVAAKGVSHSYLGFSREVARLVPAGEPLNFIKRRSDESFDGFFFYLNRPVRILEPKTIPDAPGWYLARARERRAAEPQMRRPMKVLLNGGRPKDSPAEQLSLFRLE